MQIATRVGYDPSIGQNGAVTVQAFDGNGNLVDTVGPAQRGTAAQSLSVVIDDAFHSSTNQTFVGDWVVQNVYDGFDRLITSTDAVGGVSEDTYDPSGGQIASEAWGTAGGPVPMDRSGAGNVLLASGISRYDEAGRAYESQQNVFLNTGLSGGLPTHNVPSGRTITHTGGGLASNSTTNNHTATVTLTSGGNSYVLSRQVYDRIGRLSLSAQDNTAQTSYTYDGTDRQLSKTDALGNESQSTYDPNSNITGMTRIEKCTISSSIAAESFRSLMKYDVMNRLVVMAQQGANGSLSGSLSDPSTLFTLTGYDSRGNSTNLIDPKQNTRVSIYDGARRKLQTQQHLRTDGEGTEPIISTVATQQFFDGNSRLTKLIDNNGGTTQWTYDTLDRQVETIFHDGSTRICGYDAASDVASYTDENQSVQSSSFDPLGRKTAASLTLAAGVAGTTAQSFQYDGLRRQTFTRDNVSSLNVDASFAYDSLSRVVEEGQAYGDFAGWAPVVQDNFTRADTSAGGAGTTSGAGNDWTDAQGGVYSIQGNQLQAITDSLDDGSFFRDLLVRPSSENTLDQRIVFSTNSGWNANAQWFAAPRYNGNPASKTFYLLGNYEGALYVWKVVAGALTTLAGPVAASPAMDTTHAYQFDCQCTGSSPTTLSVTLTDLTTGTQVATLTHTDSEPSLQGSGYVALDVSGNLTLGVPVVFTSVTTYAQSAVQYVTHDKYRSMPATDLTYPNGRQVASGYDLLYRRNSVSETSGGSSVAQWQFFGSRQATVTLGNGLVCSNMNDAQSRSAIQHGQPTPPWGSISTDHLGYDGAGRLVAKRSFNGSSVMVGFTSAYDKSSNKFFERALHAESRSSLYPSYDSMNRLLEYQRGDLASGGGSITTPISLPDTNQEQGYNLDGLGNWTTTTITPEGGAASVQSRTHNKLNEVTAYGVMPSSTPVLYDHGNNIGTSYPTRGNGNIADDGIRTYAYDAFNRLTAVARKSDGGTLGQYAYDALGRRIQKIVSNGGITGAIANGTTRYLYDAQQCLEELLFGSPSRQFVWGQYIDELMQMKTYVDTGSQPLLPQVYYLLSDLLYRSAALTDNSGANVEAYDADAYGNTLIYSGPGSDGLWFTDDDVTSDQPACEYVFTGRQYDPETQVYFYRARYYHPMLGRFIERDPIDYLAELNLYAYVTSNPTGRYDPLGLIPSSLLSALWDLAFGCFKEFAGDYFKEWVDQSRACGDFIGIISGTSDAPDGVFPDDIDWCRGYSLVSPWDIGTAPKETLDKIKDCVLDAIRGKLADKGAELITEDEWAQKLIAKALEKGMEGGEPKFKTTQSITGKCINKKFAVQRQYDLNVVEGGEPHSISHNKPTDWTTCAAVVQAAGGRTLDNKCCCCP